MGYHTAFDVTRVGFQWWIPALIFIFASLLGTIGWGLKTSADSRYKGLLFQFVGGIGIVGALVFFIGIYAEYHSAMKALATHDYSVAEGVVTDFVPMPPGGHSTESFRIGDVRFRYGAGWGSTVFNSEWNTGFLRDGVRARITYRGEDILKVEIAAGNH
jgi:hypothetical protein